MAELLPRAARASCATPTTRRDPDACAAVWNPDCEWHPFLTARVEGDPGYHGHNGMRAWFEDVDEMFSEIARGARPNPRGRRSAPRPRADDGDGTGQRRRGEQRGRLGGRAERRAGSSVAGPTRATRRPSARRRRRPASRPAIGRSRRSTSVGRQAPLPQDLASRRRRRSPLRRRRSRARRSARPPSMARSAARENRLVDLVEAARAPARRLRLALGLEDRGHRPGERALDQPNAEPLGVLAAGERVAALGVGDHQGHRAREQRARPRRGSALPGPRPAPASPAARST